MDSGLMYHVFRNQGQGLIIYGLKSIDRFYDAVLPCPTVVLSGKGEFKIFQHYMYMYFTADRAAAGLYSDPLTALVSEGLLIILHFAFSEQFKNKRSMGHDSLT